MISLMDVDLSDEDYVIERAKVALQEDPYAAKAWMITAKTLYPTNFGVQFEAYCIEKNSGHTKEAAKCFSDLIGKFQDKPELWKEIENVTAALRGENDSNDPEKQFLCEMFRHISIDVQHTLLLITANHCEDTMEHCKLLLLLLQRFPTAISSYGPRLVDTLLSAEKHSIEGPYPVNPYRRLLVCDLLPLLANEKNVTFELSSKLLYKLLHKSIEFFLHMMGLFGRLSAEEQKIEDPWQKLFAIVEFIGQQLDWDPYLTDFSNQNWSKDSYWQKILTFCQSNQLNMEDKQLVFCLTIFFLHCLHDYKTSLAPESSPGQTQTTFLLIEAFLDPSLPSPANDAKSKRRKSDTDNFFPHITVEKPELKNISNNFIMIVNCWDLIHTSENLYREFTKLTNHLKLDTWLTSFIIDYLIYKGRYDEALLCLQKTNDALLTKYIRIAHILYSKKNYITCFEQILLTIPLLPTNNYGTLSNNLIIGGGQRHIHFLPMTHIAVLQYCVKILLRCITENMIKHNYNELAIGHALTLTQFDWPQEEDFVPPLMEKIKSNGTFHYSLFQSYIINVDILEEITYLWTSQGGQITLDIIPHLGQRRIGTRGADKGVKEEIRQAIKRQVARSNEKLDDLTIRFITHEKSHILQTLV